MITKSNWYIIGTPAARGITQLKKKKSITVSRDVPVQRKYIYIGNSIKKIIIKKRIHRCGVLARTVQS